MIAPAEAVCSHGGFPESLLWQWFTLPISKWGWPFLQPKRHKRSQCRGSLNHAPPPPPHCLSPALSINTTFSFRRRSKWIGTHFLLCHCKVLSGIREDPVRFIALFQGQTHWLAKDDTPRTAGLCWRHTQFPSSKGEDKEADNALVTALFALQQQGLLQMCPRSAWNHYLWSSILKTRLSESGERLQQHCRQHLSWHVCQWWLDCSVIWTSVITPVWTQSPCPYFGL